MFTKQQVIAGTKITTQLQQRRSWPFDQPVGLDLDLADDALSGSIGDCIMLSHLHVASTRWSRKSSTDFFQVQVGVVDSRERQGDSGTCDQLCPNEALARLPVVKFPHERPKPCLLYTSPS